MTTHIVIHERDIAAYLAKGYARSQVAVETALGGAYSLLGPEERGGLLVVEMDEEKRKLLDQLPRRERVNEHYGLIIDRITVDTVEVMESGSWKSLVARLPDPSAPEQANLQTDGGVVEWCTDDLYEDRGKALARARDAARGAIAAHHVAINALEQFLRENSAE